MLLGQATCDQRAMAGLRIPLDTEERYDPTTRQRRHDRREIHTVEDLGGVAAAVLGRKLTARASADPLPVVLGVLKPPQLGGWGELGVVLVGDPGIGEGGLQPDRVRPGILAPANTAPLAHVEQQIGRASCRERESITEEAGRMTEK